MQLSPYLDAVAEQLGAAAAFGDDRTREIAEALTRASAPAIRLALLTALADAASEITAELLDTVGSPTVTVRLDGDQARVDVSSAGASATPAGPRRDDGDTTARISLRLGESLKSDIESAAERSGVSVNSWLVTAADAALHSHEHRHERARTREDRQITGWIRG